MNKDSIVITATTRLAASLILEFNTKYIQSNSAIETPQIYSLDNYIKKIYLDLPFILAKEFPLLLNNYQESYIWQEVLKEKDVLFKHNTAKLMQAAKNISDRWMVGFEEINNYDLNEEVSFYLGCMQDFDRHKSYNNYVTKNEAFAILINCVEKNLLSLSCEYSFIGFDDYYPLLSSFINALSEKNCVVNLSNKNILNDNTSIKRFSNINSLDLAVIKESKRIYNKHVFMTVEEELEYVANWAKNQSKTDRVAIVIPELANQRDKVESIFSSMLEPEKYIIPDSSVSEKYNISAGKSLLDYPVVYTVFKILDFLKPKISKSTLFYLLRSPFLAWSETNYILRHRLEKFFREKIKGDVELECLCDILKNLEVEEQDKEGIEWLITCFNELVIIKSEVERKKNNLLYWKGVILKTLKIFVWPGERTLNSIEYQTVERFLELLDELMSLDTLNYLQDYNFTILLLYNLYKDTVFQAKTEKLPIQILGILEAQGQKFTKIWITDLSNEVLPKSPSPNPYLPHAMQKELAMPHSSSNRELDFARELIENFKLNSQEINFSYHQHAGELILEESSLIKNIPLVTRQCINKSIEQNVVNAELEYFKDDYGLKFKENKIPMGSFALNLQMSCPFKAYAKVRLAAQMLKPISGNELLMERGILVHAILEKFWGKFKTKDRLLELDDRELPSQVKLIVEQEIRNHKLRFSYINDAYYSLESSSLQFLVLSWLKLEKDREDFSIHQLENKQEIKIGKYILNVRLDRVDNTADGLVIIDYKTGKVSLSNLLNEPDDLQLPLYCIGTDVEPSALVFAQVRKNSCMFVGISKDEVNIDGVKNVKDCTDSDWEELKENWKNIIEKLLQDFSEGKSLVKPKNAQACRYCDLASLCRIKELV